MRESRALRCALLEGAHSVPDADLVLVVPRLPDRVDVRSEDAYPDEFLVSRLHLFTVPLFLGVVAARPFEPLLPDEQHDSSLS